MRGPVCVGNITRLPCRPRHAARSPAPEIPRARRGGLADGSERRARRRMNSRFGLAEHPSEACCICADPPGLVLAHRPRTVGLRGGGRMTATRQLLRERLNDRLHHPEKAVAAAHRAVDEARKAIAEYRRA